MVSSLTYSDRLMISECHPTMVQSKSTSSIVKSLICNSDIAIREVLSTNMLEMFG